MNQKTLTVRFECPAFLGNAEQNGQWRTPPFKAQLRQWWRMVWAQEWLDKQGYPSDQRNRERMYLDLRREEGLLFGNAWLEYGSGSVGERECFAYCQRAGLES